MVYRLKNTLANIPTLLADIPLVVPLEAKSERERDIPTGLRQTEGRVDKSAILTAERCLLKLADGWSPTELREAAVENVLDKKIDYHSVTRSVELIGSADLRP